MTVTLHWTNQAAEDLVEIYATIGQQQPAAAERYFDRIERKVAMLQASPLMGVNRPDIAHGLRMLVEAPYLILYRTGPDRTGGPVQVVEIVRIVDGRRDLRSLF